MILASFSHPQFIGTTPWALLLIIPLVVSVSTVYKALIIEQIQLKRFVREIITLTISTFVFVIITAVVLYALTWLFT